MRAKWGHLNGERTGPSTLYCGASLLTERIHLASDTACLCSVHPPQQLQRRQLQRWQQGNKRCLSINAASQVTVVIVSHLFSDATSRMIHDVRPSTEVIQLPSVPLLSSLSGNIEETHATHAHTSPLAM